METEFVLVCTPDTHTTHADGIHENKKTICPISTITTQRLGRPSNTIKHNQTHTHTHTSSYPRVHTHQHPKNAPMDVVSVDARNSQNEYPQYDDTSPALSTSMRTPFRAALS